MISALADDLWRSSCEPVGPQARARARCGSRSRTRLGPQEPRHGRGRQGVRQGDHARRRRPSGGSALPSLPTVDFAKYGAIETEPLSRIQKISGPRLHASWVNIPHVTQHDEADITELEDVAPRSRTRAAARDQAHAARIHHPRVALALAEMPLFKSSLAADGESLVVKNYTHIGFAADTPNGSVVPVIRDADKKDVYELANRSRRSASARAPASFKQTTFKAACSPYRAWAGSAAGYFTPIINAPEVAILGVSKSAWQPVYRDMAFVPRLAPAAVLARRSSRDRRRKGRALHDASRRDPRGCGTPRRGHPVTRSP